MDVVCLGEALIDMFPAEIGRPLAEVSAFHPKPGGAPANVAVAAARLGASAAFLGEVGDDAFGRFLIDTLAAEGVDTRGMRVDRTARTTLAVIAMPDPQRAEFIFYRQPGQDMGLRPDDIDTRLLGAARAFHCGPLSLIDEPGRSATLRAMTTARKAGALVSFDVNYRPSIWPHPEEALAVTASVIHLAHLLKVNEHEMRLLSGHDDPAVGSAALLARGPALVVVTLGARGSYFRSAEADGFVPAFPVETIDAIGCGDAFMAGVLVGLAAGTAEKAWRARLGEVHLRPILRYASAVGALTATRHGALPALPRAAEVEAFLAGR